MSDAVRISAGTSQFCSSLCTEVMNVQLQDTGKLSFEVVGVERKNAVRIDDPAFDFDEQN